MTDYTKQTNYSKRRMFLDVEGAVTIQRYDQFAFPKQDKFTKTQRGQFWIPDEVTLTKDRIDFTNANEATRFVFTQNLLRQTALDSIQGRAPVQIFTPVCSVPETEAWVQWWSAFEQIHSESYSHIIRNIYQMPSDQFNAIHDTAPIVGMLSGIDKYYQDLHVINSAIVTKLNLQAELSKAPVLEAVLAPAIKWLEVFTSEERHIKAIYLALVASYGLEAIRFMVSFCTSLGMVENKIFIGNGNVIQLILSDELLHTDATAWMINTNVKTDPRFAQVAAECRKEVYDMLIAVRDEEAAWAKYQFSKGTILGMNEKIMVSKVDHTAEHRFRDIGIKFDSGIKSDPLPWMGKYTNTNKSQTALQENESVSYMLSAMTSEVRYDELPSL
jgi:ribonucleoside-diphosphate reductase beta chain